ncbi:MAG TPA: cache domain-containing protein [Burkholderiales bacterium]
MKTIPQSLRRRLFLLAVASILPLAAMAGLGLVALAKERRSQVERQGLEVTRALATAVDVELDRSIAVLAGLAIGPALDTRDFARYHEAMRRVLGTRPDWVTITLADPSGQQLANARREYGENLPLVVDLPSLQAAVRTRQAVVGSLETGPRGEVAVPVRVPMLRDDEVRYVLTAAVKPDAFVAVLERQRLPEDWVVSVFDGTRKRVARSRRHAEFVNQPPSPSLRQMMDQASSDEATGITLALEGDEIYTAFTRSRTTGWTVAIGIPSGIVRAAELRALAAYGGGLLLSLALGVLAALFIGRGVTAPMARLAEAARALGRREPLEVPRTGIEEIRDVASALAAAAQERAAHEAERETLLEREQRARAAAEGESRQGRVSRHARPRAAQPAGRHFEREPPARGRARRRRDAPARAACSRARWHTSRASPTTFSMPDAPSSARSCCVARRSIWARALRRLSVRCEAQAGSPPIGFAPSSRACGSTRTPRASSRS